MAAQADLGLRCPHMLEDIFSHGGPNYSYPNSLISPFYHLCMCLKPDGGEQCRPVQTCLSDKLGEIGYDCVFDIFHRYFLLCALHRRTKFANFYMI